MPYFNYTSKNVEAEASFVKGTVFNNDLFAIKLSIMLGLNVESEKNRAREGMPTLDHSFELGPLLIFKLFSNEEYKTDITFEIPVRQAFVTDTSYLKAIGIFTIPYLNIITKPSEWNYKFKTEFSIGPMFASKKYHQHFYDIEEKYARSNRPQFHSDGGYSGFQTTLILHRYFTKTIFIPFIRWDYLDNAKFINSPLVKKQNYFVGGFGLFWIFN